MIVTVMRYIVFGRRLTFPAIVRVAAGSTVSLTMHELPSRLATLPAAEANLMPPAGLSGFQSLKPEAGYQPVKEGR